MKISVLRQVALNLFTIAFLFPTIVTIAEDNQSTAAKGFSGKIFTIDIHAEHFGIIVDISESMQRNLPRIRQVLKEKTPRNPVVHVDGCGLTKPALQPKLKNGVAPDTVTAAVLLAELAEVDCILWISDMGDPPNRDGVIAMQNALDTHGIQLYLLSIKGKPGPSIRKIVESSEGTWHVANSI